MSMHELAAGIVRAQHGIAALQPRIDAAGPWPLSTTFGVEPEATWGPPETLAHLAEMLPFWMGEIERVLDGTPEPVPFGRIASDQLRIGVIGRDRTVPHRELQARIASSAERISRRLVDLSTAETERRGLHATLGEMTVETIVRRFMAAHLEEHLAQLVEILDAAEGSGRARG